MRIVSLLPVATDWLMAFGAEQDLVARSHLCRAPAEILVATRPARSRPDASSNDCAVQDALMMRQLLSLVNETLLVDLQPDIVIVQDECTVRSLNGEGLTGVLSRMRPEPEVFSFSPRTMKQILDRALALGSRVGRITAAMAFIAKAEERIQRLRARIGAQRDGTIRGGNAPRAVCLEWVDPMLAAGQWVPDLIRLAGGDPVITGAGDESRAITTDLLRRHSAEVIFVAASGRSIDPSAADLRNLATPPIQAWLVDGTRFAMNAGPSVYRTIELFAAALHVEAGTAYRNDELLPIPEALVA